jgi:NTE family protein
MRGAIPSTRTEGGRQVNGSPERLAIVLTGGGAKAAYQAGVLRAVARLFPDLHFDIITGVSAGAINALFLASRGDTLTEAVDELCSLWQGLCVDDVFRVDAPSLLRHLLGWGLRLVSGGSSMSPDVKGLVDTAPLRRLLANALPQNEDGVISGLDDHLSHCRPSAVAVTTLDYATGRTTTWVAGCDIPSWERPLRKSVQTRFTVDHIMASAALPILFPAVRLGNSWHGDGGIRLLAPLSPALHLGAGRILTISSSYAKSIEDAERPQIDGYPPPAQVLGHLMDAVFIDALDQDAQRMQRSNSFLGELPEAHRGGYRPIDLMVMRPSVDLACLAANYEERLPRGFRFLTRSLGTRETRSPGLLSLLMFQRDYVGEVMRIGEADAEVRRDELARLLSPTARVARASDGSSM